MHDVDEAILRLAQGVGPEKSICPSEAARAVAEDWRPLMGKVRARAAVLAEAGRIEILRKGKVIAPGEMRGVIRLRIKPG